LRDRYVGYPFSAYLAAGRIDAWGVRASEVIMRFRLRTLLLVVALFAVVLPTYLWLDRSFVSFAESKQIKSGMTKEEVVKLLGKPLERFEADSIWTYRSTHCTQFGYELLIVFNSDERVGH
jgi:hypothetical protein